VRQSSVNQVTAAAQSAEQATAALANGGPTIADYRTVSANVHAVQRLEALITAQKQYVTALNGS
jgi:saccharopine dehydrogenase-like NADP-dependent oxidoreductase